MQTLGVIAWSECNKLHYILLYKIKCTAVKTLLTRLDLTRGSGNHRLLTIVTDIACREVVAFVWRRG